MGLPFSTAVGRVIAWMVLACTSAVAAAACGSANQPGSSASTTTTAGSGATTSATGPGSGGSAGHGGSAATGGSLGTGGSTTTASSGGATGTGGTGGTTGSGGGDALGAACTNGATCHSGFCADGVCCQAACTAACRACSAQKKGTAGPEDGVCGFTANGTDPDADCGIEMAATCGKTGVCNGVGACEQYPAGTPCSAASCTNGMATAPSTCTGSGACDAATPAPCAPYVCGPLACKTSCAVNADCASGNYCAAAACVPKKLQGSTCTVAAQCASGFCADGFCCNNSCTTKCKSCSGAKTVGKVNGTCDFLNCADPLHECGSTFLTCNKVGSCVPLNSCVP